MIDRWIEIERKRERERERGKERLREKNAKKNCKLLKKTDREREESQRGDLEREDLETAKRGHRHREKEVPRTDKRTCRDKRKKTKSERERGDPERERERKEI